MTTNQIYFLYIYFSISSEEIVQTSDLTIQIICQFFANEMSFNGQKRPQAMIQLRGIQFKVVKIILLLSFLRILTFLHI